MRKIIAMIICAIILILPLANSIGARFVTDINYTLGDVNSDREINAKDIYCLVSRFMSGDVMAAADEPGDINADGKIGTRDAFFIKAYCAGVKNLSDFETMPLENAKIAGNFIGEYCIAVPDGMNPNGTDYAVQNAANILRTGIREAAGPDLDICNISSPAKDKIIEFHVVELGGEVDGHYIGTEEYYYKVTDGKVDIYGSKYRGNIYAAYEILEKYFGIFYYTCQETFIHKQRCVDIPDGTESYHQSVFSYRFARENFYDPGTRYGALDYYFPMRLNGTQMGAYMGDYYGSLTGPHGYNAHSFQEYYRMYHGSWPEVPNSDRYYDYIDKRESCPDPNALNHWQPCASDVGVYTELFEGLLLTAEMLTIPPHGNAVFRNDAGMSAMSFSICDNGDFCTCTLCNAKVTGKQNLRLRSAMKESLKTYTGKYTLSADGNYASFGKESDSGLYLDMGNRAAIDIQEYYPGMKIYMIIYDHTIPETVRPDENLILMYCGNGCNNHYINSGECGDNLTCLGGSNKETVETLNAWTEMCHETGAKIWFWYYPITNGYYLNGCPNISNIYYDFTYLAEIGVDGIYYEGGDEEYNFETMKAYLGSKIMWEPNMTYEEYTDIMKEYLRVNYGDGYEYIYQYILLDEESGNANGCFINNHDRPFDMHSKAYLSEHYEEMHSLLTSALELCRTDAQRDRLTLLYYCAEFMGLSASYERLYTNGNAEQRALYEARYTDMWTYMYERDLKIFHTPEIYSVPDELDFTISPMTQFYNIGSWNGWDK